VEDTRLAAFETDVSQYTFAAPVELCSACDHTTHLITVEARLIFRRAFQQLMEWKGWDDPDIVMEQETVVVAAH